MFKIAIKTLYNLKLSYNRWEILKVRKVRLENLIESDIKVLISNKCFVFPEKIK